MSRYELAGRTVAITGSTGGLGCGIAERVRSRGANVVLLDLDFDAVRRQADQLGGPRVALGLQADVRDMASLGAAVHAGVDRFGRLDVVVANAGIDLVAPMSTIDHSAFERVIDINLTGVWRTFRAALPHIQRQRGYMLAVSSMAAFVHSPLQAHYTASKAAVWAMCDSLRLEVRHLGVGVGTLHPTFFATPMMESVHTDPAGYALWGGNRRGLWAMVSRERVLDGVIDSIENRRRFVAVPSTGRVVAAAPILLRRFIDRFGFDDANIARAISMCSPTSGPRS